MILFLVTIVIIAAIVASVWFLMKWLDKRLTEREQREESAFVTDVRSQIDQKLEQSSTQINQRLTEAAKYMMELNRTNVELSRSMGQFQELGKSVKDFQDLFLSQKTRGVAGEQFLADILKAILPPALFELQYRFQDGSKVDAVIKLQDEMIPIDAKFPLENYRLWVKAATEAERNAAKKEFSRDVKNHIESIAKKYILPQEKTIDGAVMYVPIESVYAAITEDDALVGYAQSKHIWIASPNTVYQLLQIAISVYQKSRSTELVAKALQAIRGVQVETEKFGGELAKLTTHITNAKNMSDQVNSRFGRLTSRIENVAAIETAESKLLSEGEAQSPVSRKRPCYLRKRVRTLKILGSVGYHPTDKRETVSAIIPEVGFILDAGTGSYRIPEHIQTKNLYIFITHPHFDHTIGLTYLTDILATRSNVEKLTIFGPENIDLAIKTMFGTDFFPVPLPKIAEVKVTEKEFEVQGARVKTLPLNHIGPTIGYRFEFGDFNLAYITDTVVDKSYFPLTRDADLLLHECNFPSDMKDRADLTKHTDTSSFLDMFKVSLAKKAVATHLNAFDEKANGRIAGELLNASPDITVAEDGMEISL